MATATATAEDRLFHLRLIGGNPEGGVQTFKVRLEDRVTITISADKKSELHLHGYGVKHIVQAGTIESIGFTANLTGRFPLESHRQHSKKTLILGNGHGPIAYLEVHPK